MSVVPGLDFAMMLAVEGRIAFPEF